MVLKKNKNSVNKCNNRGQTVDVNLSSLPFLSPDFILEKNTSCTDASIMKTFFRDIEKKSDENETTASHKLFIMSVFYNVSMFAVSSSDILWRIYIETDIERKKRILIATENDQGWGWWLVYNDSSSSMLV
jgi:hypothetical protein